MKVGWRRWLKLGTPGKAEQLQSLVSTVDDKWVQIWVLKYHRYQRDSKSIWGRNRNVFFKGTSGMKYFLILEEIRELILEEIRELI